MVSTPRVRGKEVKRHKRTDLSSSRTVVLSAGIVALALWCRTVCEDAVNSLGRT